MAKLLETQMNALDLENLVATLKAALAAAEVALAAQQAADKLAAEQAGGDKQDSNTNAGNVAVTTATVLEGGDSLQGDAGTLGGTKAPDTGDEGLQQLAQSGAVEGLVVDGVVDGNNPENVLSATAGSDDAAEVGTLSEGGDQVAQAQQVEGNTGNQGGGEDVQANGTGAGTEVDVSATAADGQTAQGDAAGGENAVLDNTQAAEVKGDGDAANETAADKADKPADADPAAAQ